MWALMWVESDMHTRCFAAPNAQEHNALDKYRLRLSQCIILPPFQRQVPLLPLSLPARRSSCHEP